MPLLTGTRLGAYEIRTLIGAGGMGEVYRARDLQLGRDVAIKVLGNLSANPDRLRRFEQEARSAAALNHPNILAVYQLGVHDGVPYLVGELLEGETLRKQVKRGRLSVRKVVDYGVQIARGLAAAHEKGIVHRDLKPENLFVTQDGRVKILDFGLAKLTQPLPTSECGPSTLVDRTEPGVVLGTVGYMSPEQVRGEGTNYRTDIFSFGAVLYEMLTGMRAFRGNTPAETMTAILKEDPPSMLDIVPNLPLGLERIVQRCLEKSPELRFHSASDLAFALEPLSDISTSERRAPVVQPKRVRLPWAILAGAFLFAAGAGITWRWHAVKGEAMRTSATSQDTSGIRNTSQPALPHEVTISDPASYKWFDPISGQPLVWYSVPLNHGFRFFDSRGIDPHNGQELKPVTSEIVDRVRRQHASEATARRQTEESGAEAKSRGENERAVAIQRAQAEEQIEALTRKAQAAFDARDYKTAFDTCVQVLKVPKGDKTCRTIRDHSGIKMAQQLVNEGQAHFERGEFDEAAWSADKALELDPANQNAAKLKRLSLQMKPKSLQ